MKELSVRRLLCHQSGMHVAYVMRSVPAIISCAKIPADYVTPHQLKVKFDSTLDFSFEPILGGLRNFFKIILNQFSTA